MAAVREDETCTLTLKVGNGIDDQGNPKYLNWSVSQMNPEVNDSAFLLVGDAYAALTERTVHSLIRTNKYALVEDE